MIVQSAESDYIPRDNENVHEKLDSLHHQYQLGIIQTVENDSKSDAPSNLEGNCYKKDYRHYLGLFWAYLFFLDHEGKNIEPR